MLRLAAELGNRLNTIDGRGYRAYEQIVGEYSFPGYSLVVDHVQEDPFAAPSRVHILVNRESAYVDLDLTDSKIKRIAAEDVLARQIADAIHGLVKGHRGIGHSGMMAIDAAGQELLQRTACNIDSDNIEVHLSLGLPAAGRTVLGQDAASMFFLG